MPKDDDGQGYSEATPYKQKVLYRELGHIVGSAAAVAPRWHAPLVFADMTAGRGIDKTGQDGSPLIIAERITQTQHRLTYILRNTPVTMMCIDHNSKALATLRKTMSQRYPDLNVRYFSDQAEAASQIPDNAMGLIYFDPNGYNETPDKWDGLNAELVTAIGQRIGRMDILITRSITHWLRMRSAGHCKDHPTILQYLGMTDKNRLYVFPYADHDKWAFGFASNYINREDRKMRDWIKADENTEALLQRWARGKEPSLLLGIERPELWPA